METAIPADRVPAWDDAGRVPPEQRARGDPEVARRRGECILGSRLEYSSSGRVFTHRICSQGVPPSLAWTLPLLAGSSFRVLLMPPASSRTLVRADSIMPVSRWAGQCLET